MLGGGITHTYIMVSSNKAKTISKKNTKYFRGRKRKSFDQFLRNISRTCHSDWPGRFGEDRTPGGGWEVEDGGKGGDVGGKRKVFPNFLAGFCKSCCHRPAKDEINVFPQK